MKSLVLVCCLAVCTIIATDKDGTVTIPIELPEMGASLSTVRYTVYDRDVEPEEFIRESFCLSQAIWHEARGEPLRGKQLVAQTIMNRVSEDRYFPNTVCGVIQERKAGLCQFSYICERDSYAVDISKLTNKDFALYVKIIEIVNEAMRGEYKGLTHSEFYKRCDIGNSFFNTLQYTGRVGKHCWYADSRKRTNNFG